MSDLFIGSKNQGGLQANFLRRPNSVVAANIRNQETAREGSDLQTVLNTLAERIIRLENENKQLWDFAHSVQAAHDDYLAILADYKSHIETLISRTNNTEKEVQSLGDLFEGMLGGNGATQDAGGGSGA